MDRGAEKRVLGRIEGWREEMVELQKKLIPIKAISPASGGTGELAKAKFLEPLLKEIFGCVEWINAPHAEAEGGIRPNLVGRLPGQDRGRTIWFMAHMDVVPAGDESAWTTTPFEAVVKDGRIYGRGTEDNHQGLVSAFYAIKAIAAEKIVPPCDVALLLVSDEESGSRYGVRYVLEKSPGTFGKDDQFIVPDHGTADGREIEIAEKGIMRFRLTVTGKQTHAAFPQEGVNANRAVSKFIVKLDDIQRAYAQKQNPFFEPPTCTMEPTQRFANVENGNTVPGKEVQIFDCRIIPECDFDEVFARVQSLAGQIEKECGVKIAIEKMVYDPPAPITPADSPIVARLARAIGDIYGVAAEAKGSGGGTVARFLRYKNYRAAVWSRLDGTMHNPDEYCLIENMVGDAKVFASVILQG